MIPPHLRFDFDKAVSIITSFIREEVRGAGARGVVIGLSGGSDSSLATALSVRALSKEGVKVVFLPDRETSLESRVAAKAVAESLDLDLLTIDITGVVESALASLGLSYSTANKVVKGNVKVRVRMLLLYGIANNEGRLVVGTGDRSEWLIGYFTKWGDAAGDIYPNIGLYKTQVRALGMYLGLPTEVINRAPTPDLWPGHTAEGELGLSYDVIDEVLYWVFDEGLDPGEVPRRAGVSRVAVEKVMDMFRKSEHKRNPLKAPFRSFKEIMK